LQRLAAARSELNERAVVLYELHSSGAAKVVAYCPRLSSAAAALWMHAPDGIRPGMPLAEATALAVRRGLGETGDVPHLELADPLADRLAIEELAEWCGQFAPIVGLEESETPESLLLDVTGLGRLCGGEEALARRVITAFAERNLTVRAALADTLGAAWAAAHFAVLECLREGREEAAILSALAEPVIVPPGKAREALAALPPAALRLPEETCALLAELGLRELGQIVALRRETLLARFGPLVLARLDQACGAAPEAIVARAAPAEWMFEWLFEHPTARREMIEWTVEQLVERVCEALLREGRGLLRLECRFEPEQGRAERFVIGFYRPSAAPKHVGELVRLKLERVRFREPLASIRLRVLALARLECRQREFFAVQESRDAPQELAALVDRLSNRLGTHAVLRPWLLASAQPEFACQYRPVCSLKDKISRQNRGAREPKKPPARSKTSPPQEAPGARPVYLEPQPRALVAISVAPEGPPVQFRHAGRDERIVRVWGPERIETSWWRTRCVRRDYYQVETERGERYWLFRELNSGQWFLHGTFG
jgi:protein ImuB